MTTDAWLAIFHHLAVFTLLATVAAEFGLVRPGMSGADVQRVSRIDAVYGLSAIAVVAAGVARIVWGVQAVDFYLENPVFWLKMAAFGAVGLLSVVPTMHYPRWRRATTGAGAVVAVVPSEVTRVRAFIAAELVVFAAIPVCAALMARGIGG